ncbi:unnamed protein product [Darwinula stevensoni]|uniref:Uncharacterized protein n=1 Tax=Darwinula stevensoni TaxID=69355 RepID=A0A7R9AD52_9CRUS|nr:unnamed protein product [Darwinula stevensoni]CAG0900986.1 unnamed protein product [Darwinula stevensoni]
MELNIPLPEEVIPLPSSPSRNGLMLMDNQTSHTDSASRSPELDEKYSPSHALDSDGESDLMEVSPIPDAESIPLPPGHPDGQKKSTKVPVLGKSQAKKRLLAFSVSKSGKLGRGAFDDDDLPKEEKEILKKEREQALGIEKKSLKKMEAKSNIEAIMEEELKERAVKGAGNMMAPVIHEHKMAFLALRTKAVEMAVSQMEEKDSRDKREDEDSKEEKDDKKRKKKRRKSRSRSSSRSKSRSRDQSHRKKRRRSHRRSHSRSHSSSQRSRRHSRSRDRPKSRSQSRDRHRSQRRKSRSHDRPKKSKVHLLALKNWKDIKDSKMTFEDMSLLKRREEREILRKRDAPRERPSQSDSRKVAEKEKEETKKEEVLDKVTLSFDLLLHPFQVISENGRIRKDFPANCIKKTKTEPSIPYCANPTVVPGGYKSREEVFKSSPAAEVSTMEATISSHLSPRLQEPPRQWYQQELAKFLHPDDNEDIPFGEGLDLILPKSRWDSDNEDSEATETRQQLLSKNIDRKANLNLPKQVSEVDVLVQKERTGFAAKDQEEQGMRVSPREKMKKENDEPLRRSQSVEEGEVSEEEGGEDNDKKGGKKKGEKMESPDILKTKSSPQLAHLYQESDKIELVQSEETSTIRPEKQSWIAENEKGGSKALVSKHNVGMERSRQNDSRNEQVEDEGDEEEWIERKVPSPKQGSDKEEESEDEAKKRKRQNSKEDHSHHHMDDKDKKKKDSSKEEEKEEGDTTTLMNERAQDKKLRNEIQSLEKRRKESSSESEISNSSEEENLKKKKTKKKKKQLEKKKQKKKKKKMSRVSSSEEGSSSDDETEEEEESQVQEKEIKKKIRGKESNEDRESQESEDDVEGLMLEERKRKKSESSTASAKRKKKTKGSLLEKKKRKKEKKDKKKQKKQKKKLKKRKKKVEEQEGGDSGSTMSESPKTDSEDDGDAVHTSNHPHSKRKSGQSNSISARKSTGNQKEEERKKDSGGSSDSEMDQVGHQTEMRNRKLSWDAAHGIKSKKWEEEMRHFTGSIAPHSDLMQHVAHAEAPFCSPHTNDTEFSFKSETMQEVHLDEKNIMDGEERETELYSPSRLSDVDATSLSPTGKETPQKSDSLFDIFEDSSEDSSKEKEKEYLAKDRRFKASDSKRQSPSPEKREQALSETSHHSNKEESTSTSVLLTLEEASRDSIEEVDMELVDEDEESFSLPGQVGSGIDVDSIPMPGEEMLTPKQWQNDIPPPPGENPETDEEEEKGEEENEVEISKALLISSTHSPSIMKNPSSRIPAEETETRLTVMCDKEILNSPIRHDVTPFSSSLNMKWVSYPNEATFVKTPSDLNTISSPSPTKLKISWNRLQTGKGLPLKPPASKFFDAELSKIPMDDMSDASAASPDLKVSPPDFGHGDVSHGLKMVNNQGNEGHHQRQVSEQLNESLTSMVHHESILTLVSSSHPEGSEVSSSDFKRMHEASLNVHIDHDGTPVLKETQGRQKEKPKFESSNRISKSRSKSPSRDQHSSHKLHKRSKSSRKRSRSLSPRRKSRSRSSPQRISQSRSPRKKSRSKSPRKKSRSRSPRKKSRSRSPRRRPASKSLQRGSHSISPKRKSRSPKRERRPRKRSWSRSQSPKKSSREEPRSRRRSHSRSPCHKGDSRVRGLRRSRSRSPRQKRSWSPRREGKARSRRTRSPKEWDEEYKHQEGEKQEDTRRRNAESKKPFTSENEEIQDETGSQLAHEEDRQHGQQSFDDDDGHGWQSRQVYENDRHSQRLYKEDDQHSLRSTDEEGHRSRQSYDENGHCIRRSYDEDDCHSHYYEEQHGESRMHKPDENYDRLKSHLGKRGSSSSSPLCDRLEASYEGREEIGVLHESHSFQDKNDSTMHLRIPALMDIHIPDPYDPHDAEISHASGSATGMPVREEEGDGWHGLSLDERLEKQLGIEMSPPPPLRLDPKPQPSPAWASGMVRRAGNLLEIVPMETDGMGNLPPPPSILPPCFPPPLPAFLHMPPPPIDLSVLPPPPRTSTAENLLQVYTMDTMPDECSGNGGSSPPPLPPPLPPVPPITVPPPPEETGIEVADEVEKELPMGLPSATDPNFMAALKASSGQKHPYVSMIMAQLKEVEKQRRKKEKEMRKALKKKQKEERKQRKLLRRMKKATAALAAVQPDADEEDEKENVKDPLTVEDSLELLHTGVIDKKGKKKKKRKKVRVVLKTAKGEGSEGEKKEEQEGRGGAAGRKGEDVPVKPGEAVEAEEKMPRESVALPAPPERGILLWDGYRPPVESSQGEGGEESRLKNVRFADGVLPGEGSSPEPEERVTSPPLRTEEDLLRREEEEELTASGKKKHKQRKLSKEELEALPPPPPPSSPPPSYLQSLVYLYQAYMSQVSQPASHFPPGEGNGEENREEGEGHFHGFPTPKPPPLPILNSSL